MKLFYLKNYTNRDKNSFTDWLGYRRNRLLAAVIAGMAASVIMAFSSGLAAKDLRINRQELIYEEPKLTAWWGTLYPRFCFQQTEGSGTEEKTPEVKISFWLAKARNWC